MPKFIFPLVFFLLFACVGAPTNSAVKIQKAGKYVNVLVLMPNGQYRHAYSYYVDIPAY